MLNDKLFSLLLNDYFEIFLKFENKENNNNIFLRQKESNRFINEHTTQKKEEKKANKHPFENLTFTHPERFSLYSTNKKRKLEKSTPKKKNNSLFFSISNENDINIIQPIKNDKKEDNDQIKSFDKNCEILIGSNPAMESLAIDAYKSYIFSYLYTKNNSNDNFKNIENIDKEKLVKSFGLKEVPFVKLKRFEKNNNDNKKIKEKNK